MMKTIYITLFGLLISQASFSQFESYSTLANQAQDKLHSSFRSSSGTYYIENNGSSNTYFHYWWNAHALDVLVDAYERTNDSKYVTRINTLVNNWSSNNGGSIYNDYYDDMEWLSLSLFRAWKATGNGTFLNMSTDLWDDIKTGENSNQGGGIAWRKTQLDYKNVPANAPAIIYACRRHQEWGHTWELDLASDLYDWLKATLRESSGRINDGINRQGNSQIDYWQFTYNHGTFIGAALEMYQSTSNSTYLNDAIATADYAIQSSDLIDNGILRNEGTADAGLFKGIMVRYLALLAQESAVPSAKRNAYLAFLEDQAASIHIDGFNRNHDLIGVDWAQAPGSSAWMSAQLSGIMMLEIAADLGFSAPEPPVVLYEHCSSSGYAVGLGVGSYTLGDLQSLGVVNDDVSSIEVASGYSITMYEHHNFTGSSLTKSGDDSCLDDDGFNDEVSSVVVSGSGSRAGQGLTEAEQKVAVTCYPNPVLSGDQLTIQIDGGEGQAELFIYDLTGRPVHHDRIGYGSGSVSVSTGNLMSGNYILRLFANGSLLATRKLVVH